MRTSPSIAPHRRREQQDTYLVLDDFGARLGRSWCETDENAADRETLIRDLLAGQYNNPMRIVAFNASEGWSRDVTVDIADELRRRYVEHDEVSRSALAFMEANRQRLG
jgi:hypothetical protein